MFSFGETARDRERRMGTLEDKVDRLGTALEMHAVSQTAIAADFRNHAAGCEKRGARLEKLAYLLLVLMMGMLGFLLKPYFDPNAHQNITIYQQPGASNPIAPNINNKP